MKYCVLFGLSLISVFVATFANVAIPTYMPAYGYNTNVGYSGFNSFGEGGGLFQMIIFLFVFILVIQLLFGSGSVWKGGSGNGGSGYGRSGSDYDYGYDTPY